MSLLESIEDDSRRWTRIGELYEVTRKPRGLDLSLLETIPFTPMETIPEGGVYEPGFILKAPDAITSGTYYERGDLIVAKITPSFENGKQALTFDLPAPFGYATTEVIPLRPRDSRQDRRLLFFYLLHPDIRHYVAERMEGSTGRQRVPESVLLDLPFPEIDPAEQSTIADALELIQRTSMAEIRCAATARNLKRAAMRTLFVRGLRGETQKETEIGLIPQSWDVVPFDAALQIARGQVDPKVEPYASMLHIGPENVESDTGRLLQCQTAQELGLISGKYAFTKSDIVYSKIRPYLNKVVVPAFDGLCSADMYPLRPTDLFQRNFLFHFLLSESFLRQAVPHQMRTGIPKINREQLSSTSFPKPPIGEQKEIVAILDAIDRKIDLHNRKHAVLDDLFKSLLHKLMTGEIRVIDLDLSALSGPRS